MLLSDLRLALRRLRSEPGYAVLNLTALAIGLAAALLVGLYVRHEMSFDRHHEAADQLVRIDRVQDGEVGDTAPSVLKPELESMPEVEAATRLYNQAYFGPMMLRVGTEFFQEDTIWAADASLFDVFTVPFVAGSREGALDRPRTVLLTASTAERFFGDADPIGQLVAIESAEPYEVTGVIEDWPSTSHLHPRLITSLVTQSEWSELDDTAWRAANFAVYARLAPGASRESLQARLDALPAQYLDAEQRAGVGLAIQPVTRIHLDRGGARTRVLLLLGVCVLLVLLACVNTINLSVARASRRFREVGVRQALGSGRAALQRQFLVESGVTVTLALVLAVGLTAAAVGAFSQIAGVPLSLAPVASPMGVAGLLGLGVGVVVLSGGYPAALLSRVPTVRALRGRDVTQPRRLGLREGLIVFQLAASFVLVVGSLVIARQVEHTRTTDLGMETERVWVVPAGGSARGQVATLLDAFEQHPSVRAVAATSSPPSGFAGGYTAFGDGIDEEGLSTTGVEVSRDIVDALGIDLVAGTSFPESRQTVTPDSTGYLYLVNETFVRQAGWTTETAVGRTLDLQGRRLGEVVGVMRDFHYASLHETIEPLAFYVFPPGTGHLILALENDPTAATREALASVWASRVTDRPFDVRPLDLSFQAHHDGESRAGEVAFAATGMALLIAALGLIGLAALAAQQRRQEVGIRKVLGASVASLMALLMSETVRLAVVALAMGLPLAYIASRRWLEGFAYAVPLGLDVFLIAGAFVLIVAASAVTVQALRAALADPIRAIRTN
ncbi:MAG: FtsX-like permease family protein [Bacteroidota bacterium]